MKEDGPCRICGELTNSLAGNPGQWPIFLPHISEPGVAKHHHSSCVLRVLAEVENLKSHNEYMQSVADEDRATIQALRARVAELESRPNTIEVMDSVYPRCSCGHEVTSHSHGADACESCDCKGFIRDMSRDHYRMGHTEAVEGCAVCEAIEKEMEKEPLFSTGADSDVSPEEGAKRPYPAPVSMTWDEAFKNED